LEESLLKALIIALKNAHIISECVLKLSNRNLTTETKEAIIIAISVRINESSNTLVNLQEYYQLLDVRDARTTSSTGAVSTVISSSVDVGVQTMDDVSSILSDTDVTEYQDCIEKRK